MSEENQIEDRSEGSIIDELAVLKQRADILGIKFHPNISLDKLREKVQAAMEGSTKPSEPKEESHSEIRARLLAEQMKLVRIRISCLDPKKKELEGEIITVANSYIGTVRKFVPYGEKTDNGYHVPYCIYQFLKDRQFLQIRTRKVGGKEFAETNWVKEFSIEVLPQLTKEELADLAAAQLARGDGE